MVEIDSESRRIGPRNVDWIAVYDGWLRGGSAEHLAQQFGLRPKTVSLRCGWVDQHFPPGAPTRLIVSFAQALDDAHALLESDEPAQAERRARALTALIRAARALEDWTMDKRKPAAAKPVRNDQEVSAEYDPRAELERRLRSLLDFERKRREEQSLSEQGVTRPAGAVDTGDAPRPPASVGELGQG